MTADDLMRSDLTFPALIVVLTLACALANWLGSLADWLRRRFRG